MSKVSEFNLYCNFSMFEETYNKPCNIKATHEIYFKTSSNNGLCTQVCADHCAILVRRGFKDVTDTDWPWYDY